MRKNTGKPRKRTQAARPLDEAPAPDPVDTEISVMLFPLNVWMFDLI